MCRTDRILLRLVVRAVAGLWFRALERIVTEAGPGGFTPSDMTLLDLSQDEIDEFENDLA
ncbi:hypothetical protein ACFQ1S_13440 [Kibdelosporangium lantanae]|uniref:Uncharacterized protein n=1 Tax=Kibdelosporangium lantanae TaxID=1497396 RepID=A0ABW3M6Z1_9PSEU